MHCNISNTRQSLVPVVALRPAIVAILSAALVALALESMLQSTYSLAPKVVVQLYEHPKPTLQASCPQSTTIFAMEREPLRQYRQEISL